MKLQLFLKPLRWRKKQLSVVIALMLLESIVSLTVPWFAGVFSQAILEDKTFYDLSYMQIAMIWLMLFASQAMLRFLSTYRVNFIGAQILTELSCRLYDHIQLLPVKYFNKTKKGETLALLSNDVSILSYFLSGVLTGIVPMLFVMVGALVLMATLNMTIALMILFMVPAFFIVLKLLGKNLRPLTENIVQRQADSVAIASENFGLIKLVKSFAREKEESARFKSTAYEIEALRKKQLKLQAILSPLVQFLVSTGVLAIVVVCAVYYQAGQLTMPQLISLLMYGLLFARPMSSFANLYGQVQQAIGASNRLTNILNLDKEPSDAQHSTSLVKGEQQSKGEIQFNDVSFSYEGQQLLFDNLNITVEAGTTIVVTGDNGCGKSTILHLLMRFMEPSKGKIEIDGAPLTDVSLSSLRQYVGLVSQDITLSNGSIIENIAYGYPQASFEEIESAAKKAGAHSFISEFEQGYQTQVGENGVLLSGGQRQRISLARALLSDPQILLLDEPTSMVDKGSVEEIISSLSDILSTKTAVIVTHDHRLLALADKSYEIKQQTVTELPLQNTSAKDVS